MSKKWYDLKLIVELFFNNYFLELVFFVSVYYLRRYIIRKFWDNRYLLDYVYLFSYIVVNKFILGR